MSKFGKTRLVPLRMPNESTGMIRPTAEARGPGRPGAQAELLLPMLLARACGKRSNLPDRLLGEKGCQLCPFGSRHRL